MKEGLYNYAQIAKKTGKSVDNVRKLAQRLDLERILKKGVSHVSQESFEILEQHFKPKYKRGVNSKIKVSVIEQYLKTFNYRHTSKILSISRTTVRKIVEEFEVDGFIVVDSSMNFAEKLQNKNIFKKGKFWGYSFTYKGIKYYKSGYDLETTASEEMTRVKENLKNG